MKSLILILIVLSTPALEWKLTPGDAWWPSVYSADVEGFSIWASKHPGSSYWGLVVVDEDYYPMIELIILNGDAGPEDFEKAARKSLIEKRKKVNYLIDRLDDHDRNK